jgi:hypothetical protein
VDDHVHNVRLAPSLHGQRIIQQHFDDLFCERHSAGAQVGIPGSHTRPAPSSDRSGSMDAWTRGGQLLRGRLRPGEACTFKLSHFYRLRPMQLHRISDIRRASRVRTGRRRHHSINEDRATGNTTRARRIARYVSPTGTHLALGRNPRRALSSGCVPRSIPLPSPPVCRWIVVQRKDKNASAMSRDE